jgi:colicin import membrane protein
MIRKVILSVFVAASLPFCVEAQSQGLFSKKKIQTQKDISEYMHGAVPEVNGKVVFSQIIASPGKNKTDLYNLIATWASLRYLPKSEKGDWKDKDYFKNYEYSEVRKGDINNGIIECVGDEEIVFSKKTLSTDFSKINYLLTIKISDGSVEVKMDNIAYTYNVAEDVQRIEAEDWITDKESFTKKGKFYRVNGKFRTKTIDLKNQLFEEIKNAITK